MAEIKIVQFRRGRHTQKPRHFILSIEGVEERKKAEEYCGKEVVWTSKGNKKIKGKIVAPHGNKGRVRAIFEKGLPGQALGSKVELIGVK